MLPTFDIHTLFMLLICLMMPPCSPYTFDAADICWVIWRRYRWYCLFMPYRFMLFFFTRCKRYAICWYCHRPRRLRWCCPLPRFEPSRRGAIMLFMMPLLCPFFCVIMRACWCRLKRYAARLRAFMRRAIRRVPIIERCDVRFDAFDTRLLSPFAYVASPDCLHVVFLSLFRYDIFIPCWWYYFSLTIIFSIIFAIGIDFSCYRYYFRFRHIYAHDIRFRFFAFTFFLHCSFCSCAFYDITPSLFFITFLLLSSFFVSFFFFLLRRAIIFHYLRVILISCLLLLCLLCAMLMMLIVFERYAYHMLPDMMRYVSLSFPPRACYFERHFVTCHVAWCLLFYAIRW